MYGTGKAWIDVKTIAAGSCSCWTVTYETGAYGIDDGGEIIIARRDVCDSDIPQFTDPNQPGYVFLSYDADAVLTPRYVIDRYIRPWKSCISLKVSDGSLAPGDLIRIHYGSPAQGPGYRMQTFAEAEHLFRVMADCAGSGNFYDVAEPPAVRVAGGQPDVLQGVAPSQVLPGKPFDLFVRAIDSWGNIAEDYQGLVTVTLPEEMREVRVDRGCGWLRGVVLDQTGPFRFDLKDQSARLSGRCNPVECLESAPETQLFWGDMHGQTRETVGTGTPDLYFAFARDYAKMDFCAWQGNDFQITDETWQIICQKVKEYHQPGRFITFLGYEWSGTTPTGGDYNIYYLKDDQPLHRSYHWQIDMNTRDGSERHPIAALWQEFRGRDDVMAVPHVGGRYGNLDYYDEAFVHNVEIHSHHGSFQWLLEDALKKGLQPGVVAASDDHTCRPGLSYPTRVTSRGFVSFDVTGGYTAVFARDLSRQYLWQALRERRCYGTSGARIILDVSCAGHRMGDAFSLDRTPVLSVHAVGTDIIEEIEIKRGVETIYRYASTLPRKVGSLRISWSGVRVRSRKKKTDWKGCMTMINGSIRAVRSCYASLPERQKILMSNQQVAWQSATSGDSDGFELDYCGDGKTGLVFASAPVTFSISLQDLEQGRVIRKAGGVNLQVEIDHARIAESHAVDITYADEQAAAGVNPYWVKVIQKDGHMAWSSPMYLDLTKNCE